MSINRLSHQEIYQYLSAHNFNLTSEKILKDPQSYSDIVWNILYFLSAEIKDGAYDHLEPSLVYILDADVHRNSLKKMREYITVSAVLRRLGFSREYPIK